MIKKLLSKKNLFMRYNVVWKNSKDKCPSIMKKISIKLRMSNAVE